LFYNSLYYTEKDWSHVLGKDASFFTLYNAVGATKELTEKFSVNAEIANMFSKTDDGDLGELKFDTFIVGAKLITKVTENVEFNAGLEVGFENTALSGGFGDTDDNLTVFSVPVGITLSFFPPCPRPGFYRLIRTGILGARYRLIAGASRSTDPAFQSSSLTVYPVQFITRIKGAVFPGISSPDSLASSSVTSMVLRSITLKV
jgi:hypothetical protein